MTRRRIDLKLLRRALRGLVLAFPDFPMVPGVVPGCWVRAEGRGLDKEGYARITVDRKRARLHRVVYELLVGDIPAGLVLDHECRNRACVNPGHLTPCSSRHNTIRGAAARRAGRTMHLPFDFGAPSLGEIARVNARRPA